MSDLGFNYHRQPSCQTCRQSDANPVEGGVCSCHHPKQRPTSEAWPAGCSPLTNWDGICDLHEPRETP